MFSYHRIVVYDRNSNNNWWSIVFFNFVEHKKNALSIYLSFLVLFWLRTMSIHWIISIYKSKPNFATSYLIHFSFNWITDVEFKWNYKNVTGWALFFLEKYLNTHIRPWRWNIWQDKWKNWSPEIWRDDVASQKSTEM